MFSQVHARILRSGIVSLAICSVTAFAQGGRPGQQQQPRQPSGQQQTGTNNTDPNAKPEPPASISGRVIQAQSGAPLKKVMVVLNFMGRRSTPAGAMTDADGNFTVPNLQPGQYRMSATRTGYVWQDSGPRTTRTVGPIGGGGGGTTLTISSGQELKDVLIRMMPGGVITGRILDEDGEPLSGVQVQAMRSMYSDGQKRLTPGGSGQSDDRGEYRIFGLAPQQYYLSANLRNGGPRFGGGALTVDGSDESFATLYYPGTPDVERAIGITVRGGEEFHADMTLIHTHTYSVRGRVMSAAGEPANNGAVGLLQRATNISSFQPAGMGFINGKDGKFEIKGVVPGSYTLMAGGGGDIPQAGRLDVDLAEADLEGITVITYPGRDISGTVRVDGNTSLKFTAISVGLQPLTGGFRFGGGGLGAQVKDDGSFTLNNVMDDDYILRASAPGADWYVKSARIGNEDILRSVFVPAKVKGATLEITLSDKAGKVEGTVMNDGQPALSAVVALVPDESTRVRSERSRVTTSDQNGKFSLGGVRPGSYKLYAWEQLSQGAADDPDFIGKYADMGKSVRVGEKDLQTVDLKLITGADSDKVQ